MELFIPKNLEKLEVISELKKLIENYSEKYYEGYSSSFDNYYYYLKNDAVNKFIFYCLDKSDVSADNDYQSVVNYLSRLFYSVKGTPKVFEYMEKYLGLKITKLEYTLQGINLDISGAAVLNINDFAVTLKNFLNALLYYQDLKTAIETLDLIVNNKIGIYTSIGMKRYRTFTVETIEKKDNEETN